MKNEVKRVCVGIDMAKDAFHCAIMFLLVDQSLKCKASRKFSNSVKGFKEFLEWVEKNVKIDCSINFTMEATGVYYENLAFFLYNDNRQVNVLLPNKVKKFAESLGNKSKTDKIDSKIIGQMGVERHHMSWDPGSKIFQRLKKLTRERENIQKDRTALQNQIHAEKHSIFAEEECLSRYNDRLDLLNEQLKIVDKQIEKTIASDEEVNRKVKQIKKTPGISTTTIATVIAETYGFAAFTSIKQVTSFAGLDVVQKESGNYKGKTRISKKGNSHIRRVLYMPSLNAKQYNPTLKIFYERLNIRKDNALISTTAVQRKLLCLIYTLWKNDTEYIENYEAKKKQEVENIVHL